MRVWAIAFAYAAVSALLVHLVVLPYVLPAWHGGEGLLAGGDWTAFHQYAATRAARIRARGWSAFELRPLGQAPVGIASAIYALTWPKPWTLIPLNAALHATAAALLFLLLRGFARDWRWAAVGAGPFVFYPTALMWVTQIHKDGYFIAGYLALFVAWADLARWDLGAAGWCALWRPLLLVPAGFGLIWLVRPDLAIVAYGAGALALAVLGVGTAARLVRDPSRWRAGLVVAALAALATLAAAWLTGAPARLAGAWDVATQPLHDSPASWSLPPVQAGHGLSTWVEPTRRVTAIPWDRTPWLPAAVDGLAYQIALTRERFLVFYFENRSNVDVDVGFYRASDLLRYLPRALQIVLLAPFPTDWGDGGSLAWTTVGRRVVALEMVGVYAGLCLLPAVLLRSRRRAELWIVVLPCLAILGLYSLAVSNLGALHRFRYGFLMTLVGLGLTGGRDLLAWIAGPSPGRPATR
jgi:hypothetical protein